ncbi:MAG TPA: glutathione-disulfide reductase [Hypericibacter adhaerens]|jgi:glutathione reductase (NADPH)|uniref:Glutathione reductase n=1 Tax=Hypericibacter adhaerens TaxID=2602016 RepID=A0A5J6N8Q6_9PROT|nr:glutathione-disulfide reductase [Hypericibacter adhaerens]QEX23706.1 glutathione-disulfide reductase [Hypericibacter adhaerens]HWA45604.1 glutathione-disulfide reductase [Hypericibacter adhaerens]
MSGYDYDLFVIGGGSGGVRAGRIAATHGAKVAVTEEYRYGGTCVIRGCIPKKLFVYASHFHEDFEDAAAYGWTLPAGPRFDWGRLVANKDKEIERLSGLYRKALTSAGADVFEGRARLTDPHTVDLGGRHFTAARILIATGGRPQRPTHPGAELGITSNEAFHLEHLPGRVLVVGGGYIAVEFAGIFNGLGVKTVLAYRGEQILRGFDKDLRHFLAAEIGKKGIDLRLETSLKGLKRDGAGIAVEFADGRQETFDQVLYATGRVPNTEKMGLEAAGVALDAQGAVVVDDDSRSSVGHIFAIGDVTNRINLTPVAIREGHAFADTVFGNKPWRMSHETVPSAVFSQPPVGTVGLSEETARGRHGALDIYKTSFRPLKHTLTGREERTLMKLVVDRASQRVLGAHMVGADAPEIIQAIAIAVKMGATKTQFDATMALHPTAAEEFVTLRTPEPDPKS